MRILFTGGGTGGHVYPIVAVGRALKALPTPPNERWELFFAGPTNFPLKDLETEDVKITSVPSGKIRRYFSLLNMLSPFIFLWGIIRALWVVWRIMPDVIWAKGGYGSVPIGIAGWLYHIPLFIHESDAIPGAANLFLRHLAARIAVAFPETVTYFPKKRTAVVGNPTRQGIINASAENAKTTFKLTRGKPMLLVLGGSQGAASINALIAEALPLLLPEFDVILQCGRSHFKSFTEELTSVFRFPVPGTPGLRVLPLLSEDELGQALAASCLVISRAGASSIFDIALSGRPSILIPLKSAAQGHQERNAFDYARGGGAVVLQENNLTPHLLVNEVKRITGNKELAQSMAKSARAFTNANAADTIAHEIFKLITARLPALANSSDTSSHNQSAPLH